jgi:hypothetical protein
MRRVSSTTVHAICLKTLSPLSPRGSRRHGKVDVLNARHANYALGPILRGRLQIEENVIVRFGSLADICTATSHVRFTPNSDRESEIPQNIMSALPPKADMCGATTDVRYGPIADIAQIPACLIADVNMPAMTGIELYRCLHAALTAQRAT